MRRKLVVLGTSGFAREMAMLAEHVNARTHEWDIVGFIGEPGVEVGRSLGIAPILGDDAWLLGQDFEADLVCGIGYPAVRRRVMESVRDNPRFRFPNLIHPTACCDYRRVELGVGNTITMAVTLTCDIVLGDFNSLNLQVTVGHDARIGSYNVVNPSVNISGGVTLGDGVLIGTGAQLLERLRIGDEAVVGAGAVVVSDVAAATTVVGVPAKTRNKV